MLVPTKRLTDFANCAGCAGKLSPMGIAQVLRALPPRSDDPRLLVATETADDAGVYALDDRTALVQTVDFFPPLVDDPFQYGQIAAANALSDVYAMNGQPLTALNIVCFPDDALDLSVLSEILRGGAERVQAAGAVLVGGHSLRDKEIKYGISVTGLVNVPELLTNATAREGDVLVLTKPLGTGFITTAHKKEACPLAALARGVDSMISLNSVGRDALRAAGGVHALTDVTGYGLAGHAAEIAEASKVTIVLDTRALPRIEGSETLAISQFHCRASGTNRDSLKGRMRIAASAYPVGTDYAFDPQTSGGLLISIDPAHSAALIRELNDRGAKAAAVVGRVEARRESIAIELV